MRRGSASDKRVKRTYERWTDGQMGSRGRRGNKDTRDVYQIKPETLTLARQPRAF